MPAMLLSPRRSACARAGHAIPPLALLFMILLVWFSFSYSMLRVLTATPSIDGFLFAADGGSRSLAALALIVVGALAVRLLHAFACAALLDPGAVGAAAKWRWRGVAREFRRRQRRNSRVATIDETSVTVTAAAANEKPDASPPSFSPRSAAPLDVYSSDEDEDAELISAVAAAAVAVVVAPTTEAAIAAVAAGRASPAFSRAVSSEAAADAADVSAASATAAVAIAAAGGDADEEELEECDVSLGDDRVDVITTCEPPPEEIFTRPGPHSPKWCRKCSAIKPPRTHHCSTCQRCVLKMDHHCPWVANCVGAENYKAFTILLAAGLLALLVVISVWSPLASGAWQPLVGSTGASAESISAANAPFLWANLPGLAVGGLALAYSLCATLFLFCAMHAWLIVTGRTTLEGSLRDGTGKSPYSLGTVRENARILYGLQPRTWCWPYVSRDVLLATLGGMEWRRGVAASSRLEVIIWGIKGAGTVASASPPRSPGE